MDYRRRVSYAEALEEAWTLYDQGNYEEAKSLAREAYEGSLALEGEPLAPEDRVLYLRTLCNISHELQENQEVIDLATEVLAYATDPLDTSFANTHIGTQITADKDVVVISGSWSGRIGSEGRDAGIDQLIPTLEEAFQQEGPALVAVPVDYAENRKLTKRLGDLQFSI